MTQPNETSLRHNLGIPDDAQRVILFAESSHWDPNWLQTAEDYYKRLVAPNLDLAINALTHQPRRIYSVECIFFLRMYWERRPERRSAIRELVNQGRLRLTSSGVTTADTLLPCAEAILRDFLIGQEWLRKHGMTWEPRLAYFTDSFGCSPALPSLLRAAGFDRTAVTRIDGMHFVGCDLEPARNFPRPGSSAARLLKTERSLDFFWRDMNGAQVLCHWNAYTYFQGDLLAHRGVTRAYFLPLAIPARSERHVAHRIGQYVAQLAPTSRTPYLFCPIGIDFVAPIPDLIGLLDRYNQVRYPTTGVWAVNAGLDDYLALVECHREALPVIQIDPNPYWTGFYTARPALKQRCHQLVDRLLLAEQLALSPKDPKDRLAALTELDAAWWQAVVANHHDFITGTSPDKVVYGEQWPWLNGALKQVQGVIRRLAPTTPQASRPTGPSAPSEPQRVKDSANKISWAWHEGVLRVRTPHTLVEISAEAGGCITGAWGPDLEQAALLTGPSNDLISYHDSGGLWRLGHEYRGGFLKPKTRASQRGATLQVFEIPNGLEVLCDMYLDGAMIRRTLRFLEGSPLIYGRVAGRAPRERTVSLSFGTDVITGQMAMAQPGGVATRPALKLYDPTFWPLQSFVHLEDDTHGRGVAIFVAAPGAVAYRGDGRVELIALRNATRERAYRFIPRPANPASGYELERYSFDYAILFTPTGDWRANRLPYVARQLFSAPWEPADQAALRTYAASLVKLEGRDGAQPDVFVTALKPASRGEGLILRLSALDVPQEEICVTLRGRTITQAFLCDARERDLQPLAVQDGRAYLTMPGSIATLRVLCKGQ